MFRDIANQLEKIHLNEADNSKSSMTVDQFLDELIRDFSAAKKQTDAKQKIAMVRDIFRNYRHIIERIYTRIDTDSAKSKSKGQSAFELANKKVLNDFNKTHIDPSKGIK